MQRAWAEKARRGRDEQGVRGKINGWLTLGAWEGLSGSCKARPKSGLVHAPFMREVSKYSRPKSGLVHAPFTREVSKYSRAVRLRTHGPAQAAEQPLALNVMHLRSVGTRTCGVAKRGESNPTAPQKWESCVVSLAKVEGNPTAPKSGMDVWLCEGGGDPTAPKSGKVVAKQRRRWSRLLRWRGTQLLPKVGRLWLSKGGGDPTAPNSGGGLEHQTWVLPLPRHSC